MTEAQFSDRCDATEAVAMDAARETNTEKAMRDILKGKRSLELAFVELGSSLTIEAASEFDATMAFTDGVLAAMRCRS